MFPLRFERQPIVIARRRKSLRRGNPVSSIWIATSRHAVLAVLAMTAGLLANPAFAAEHFVKMLSAHPSDKSRNNLFDPPILKIAPGDTVTFLPTEPGHNTASKSGMIPDGAEGWNTKLDQKFSISFKVEGTYGYICVPHLEMGMVGLILVGDYKRNLEGAKAVRQYGMAREIFEELFEKIGR